MIDWDSRDLTQVGKLRFGVHARPGFAAPGQDKLSGPASLRYAGASVFCGGWGRGIVGGN